MESDFDVDDDVDGSLRFGSISVSNSIVSVFQFGFESEIDADVDYDVGSEFHSYSPIGCHRHKMTPPLGYSRCKLAARGRATGPR